MSRNPEDLFNKSSSPIFSTDKSTRIFNTAANKAAAIDGTVGEKKRDLGIPTDRDRKSTRLNSSHQIISYAVFCLKKKK